MIDKRVYNGHLVVKGILKMRKSFMEEFRIQENSSEISIL